MFKNSKSVEITYFFRLEIPSSFDGQRFSCNSFARDIITETGRGTVRVTCHRTPKP